MKYCEKCQAFREDKFAFCNKCGTPLVEREEPVKMQPADAAGIVCSNCGTVLAADMRFCNKCGTPVSTQENVQREDVQHEHPVQPVQEETVLITPEQPVYEEPKTELMPVSQYTAPLPEIPPMPAPQFAPAPQGKKPNMVLLIILAVIGAIILFGGSFLLTEYFVYHVTPMELLGFGSSEDAEDEESDDAESAKDKKKKDKNKEKDEEEDADEQAAEADEAATIVEAEPAPAATEAPTPEPTPEPTPTPYVWEDWDLNFNAEQSAVDDWVKASRKNKGHYKKHDYSDTYYYTQDGNPVIMGAKKDVNGWKYNREYVGAGIYYVEMDDGYQTTQKFYFAEGKLFRVIDEDGSVHDYASPGWEDYNEIGERLIEEREALMDDYKWRNN